MGLSIQNQEQDTLTDIELNDIRKRMIEKLFNDNYYALLIRNTGYWYRR